MRLGGGVGAMAGGVGAADDSGAGAHGWIDRGHRVTVCLRERVQTTRLLEGRPAPRLRAPLWLHRTVGVSEPQASRGETLLTLGYQRPELPAPRVQCRLTPSR